jgi:hypothetical protein
MAEALQAIPSQLARRALGGGDEAGRDPSTPRPGGGVDPQRRRSARRTTILLVVLALALYFGFITYALLRGFRTGANVRHAAAHAASPAAAPTTSPATSPAPPSAATPAAR